MEAREAALVAVEVAWQVVGLTMARESAHPAVVEAAVAQVLQPRAVPVT